MGERSSAALPVSRFPGLSKALGRARRSCLGARASALPRDIRSIQRCAGGSARSAQCARTAGRIMTCSSDIRILMTTDTVGGVWTYSCALASGLAASGADVHLVTMGPRARADQRAMLRDPRVHLVETDLALEWQDPAGHDLANARTVLGRLEAGIRPDIVHLNSYREAAFDRDTPAIVVAHSCVNSWARACRDTGWL